MVIEIRLADDLDPIEAKQQTLDMLIGKVRDEKPITQEQLEWMYAMNCMMRKISWQLTRTEV